MKPFENDGDVQVTSMAVELSTITTGGGRPTGIRSGVETKIVAEDALPADVDTIR